MILRGKNGHFLRYLVPKESAHYPYVFVGCMAENSKSEVIMLSLKDSLPATRTFNNPDNECMDCSRAICYSFLVEISAQIHPRERPAPVSMLSHVIYKS